MSASLIRCVPVVLCTTAHVYKQRKSIEWPPVGVYESVCVSGGTLLFKVFNMKCHYIWSSLFACIWWVFCCVWNFNIDPSSIEHLVCPVRIRQCLLCNFNLLFGFIVVCIFPNCANILLCTAIFCTFAKKLNKHGINTRCTQCCIPQTLCIYVRIFIYLYSYRGILAIDPKWWPQRMTMHFTNRDIITLMQHHPWKSFAPIFFLLLLLSHHSVWLGLLFVC